MKINGDKIVNHDPACNKSCSTPTVYTQITETDLLYAKHFKNLNV